MPSMEVTTRIGCTNMCSYCPQDRLLAAYRGVSDVMEMSVETFSRCIDRIPVGVDIHFSGFSEPWLNPRCTEMLLYAHRKGHRINVFTTLIGMDVADVEAFRGVPFGQFVVHVPDSGGRMRIPLDDRYRRSLAAVVACLPDISVVYYGDIHADIRAILGDARREEGELTWRAGNLDLGRPSPGRATGHIRCTRSMRQNVLLPNGDVVLCCNDYGLENVLGNLMHCSYDSLFSGTVWRDVTGGLADETRDILCRRCQPFAVPVEMPVSYGVSARLLRRARSLRDRIRDMVRAGRRLVL